MSRLNNEIDAICDEFEEQIREDKRVRAEDFLARVEFTQRERLLIELLSLELAYRANTSTPLDEAEVISRFPNQPGLYPQITDDVPSEEAVRCGLPDSESDFGEYQLLEEIARGGMGVVYRARHRDLDRVVALKMILSAQLASPESVQRFQSEARAAAKLDHPGIVPIFKVGEHDGQHYFSMGLVEGRNLAQRIEEGPLSAKESARIARQVALAAHHAHEQGIVHRDLKPANILLDRQGQPKVTDFGLAKNLGNDGELTLTGQVLGTPNYMAPEQARGDMNATSPAVDIHAIGAILYSMLTGQPPFQAATIASTLRLVTEEEALSPRSLVSNVPRDLETICHKCLEKEPDQRYASAKMVADELDRFLVGKPILARPVSVPVQLWRWVKRHPVVAMLTAGLAAALLFGALFSMHFARQSWIEARKQRLARKEADRARDEAQDVADFILTDMFGRATPHQDGADLRVVDVLDQAAAKARERFADAPHRLISVLKLIGDAYGNLSQAEKAAGVTEQLVELQKSIAGADDRITIQFQTSLAGRLRGHDPARAESILRSSLEKQRRLLGPEDIDTLYTTSVLGDVLQMRGKHEEGRELLTMSIDCYRNGIRDRSNSHYPGALSYLAASYLAERDYERAQPILEEWKAATEGTPVHHPSSLALLHVYAQMLSNQGRYDEAIPLYERAIEAAGNFYQEHDRRVAILKVGLSNSLRAIGQFSEAMRIGTEGYESLRDKLGYNNYGVEQAVSSVIATAAALGDKEKELKYRRDALICRLRIAGPDQDDGIVGRFNEYVKLLEEVRGRDALREFRKEFNQYGGHIAVDDYRRGHFLSNWGWIQSQQADVPEHIDQIERSLIDGYEHIEARFNEPEAKQWARNRVADYLRSIGKEEEAAAFDEPSNK